MENRQNNRLAAAFTYLDKLAFNYRAQDFIDGKVSLTKNQFHDLLNHFLDSKIYPMCTALVNRWEEVSLKYVKVRL